MNNRFESMSLKRYVGSENFAAQFSLPTTGKKKPSGTQGTVTNELLELPENGICN